jgi:two-component system, OmpR family, phosphate regulon response regulator PhoB
VSSSPTLDRSVDLRRPRFRLIVADADVAASLESPLSGLDRHGIDVDVCGTGAETLLRAATGRPDAALVAAGPGELGSTELVRLLVAHVCVPVLVGIGTGEGGFAGPALAAGATACVARPYLADELLPILRSVRPEAITDAGPPVQCGSLRLDPGRLEVSLHGRPIRLPLREFDLLQYFMTHADRLLTRDDIWAAVWGGPGGEASNTLTVHIKRLRARLGDDQSDLRIILTIRGLGYRFVPPA